MAGPNMIGGSRMSRMERSGDRRQFEKALYWPQPDLSGFGGDFIPNQ